MGISSVRTQGQRVPPVGSQVRSYARLTLCVGVFDVL